MKYFNYSRDIKKAKSSLLLILFGFLLISCGGDGSSSPESVDSVKFSSPRSLETTGSVFIEFNFRKNNENFDAIERIIIEYTTNKDADNVREYEYSVDTIDDNDFTKDTPYTLENLISDTIYYYRIMVHYANSIPEEQTGNFKTNSIDNDGNGLIEIGTLRQLHNMRYNLKGTNYKDNSNATGNTSGCPNAVCRGYELTRNLDFDKDKDGSTWSTSDNDKDGTIEYTLDASDNAEPYFVVDPDGSGGWKPIGTRDIPFQAVFEGNSRTISSLAMSRDLQYLGMFGAIGASADISNLGLVANLADYTGNSSNFIYVGGLVGRGGGGSITTSYTTGAADGGAGDKDFVGGLVARNIGNITDSYATGAVAGGAGRDDYVGGLTGLSEIGIITRSYATGAVAGEAGYDFVGGLVGLLQKGGSITASYATGGADGGAGIFDNVGGLVGKQSGGSITASYATGGVDGGDDNNDRAGGLVGWQTGGSITASYATGGADGGAGTFENVGGLVGYQEEGSITASYATGTADGGDGDDDRAGGLVGWKTGGSITASYATGTADGGIGERDIVGGLVGLHQGGGITDSYSFGKITNAETIGDVGNAKGNATMAKDITADILSWNSAADNTFSAWDFGTNRQPPILKYADYDGATDGRKFACLGSDNTTIDANTIYIPYCGDFLPGQGVSIGVDISSNGAKFDFNNLRDFTDITSISIGYTTSDNSNYELSVDTDNNTDFTKDMPYILPNITPRITYYYLIMVARGGEQEIFSGDFRIFVADVDSDGNGLIEISTLTQLHNMRYNLKGTSYKPASDDVGNSFGCPATGCFGYELTRDLDFDQDNDGSTWSTSDADNNGTIEYTLDAGDNAEPYFVVDLDGSGGWIPIGYAQLSAGQNIPICDNKGNNTCFDAIFEGNGYTISSLAMRRDLQYLGIFGATGASADIRNLGLLANLTNYTGSSNNLTIIGGVVGLQNRGSITASYATGAAAGGAGELDSVGGLVGGQSEGIITASYATGAVAGGDGSNDIVGGLVGLQSEGIITASYATGSATGGDGSNDIVGGLVGSQSEGSITDSYATGAVAGGAGNFDIVGGLVGSQSEGSITDSYATGDVFGGDGSDIVGGLVGDQFGGSITASYAKGRIDGGVGNFDRVGGLVGSQSEGIITASYAKGRIDGGVGNFDRVGGLVGSQSEGIITASYATGDVFGGDGSSDFVGGLVGDQFGGSITASYATGNADGGAGISDFVGGLVGFQIVRSITDSYSFGEITNAETSGDVGDAKGNATMAKDITADIPSWNSTTNHTFRAWDFTTDQPPALKYADYDGIIDATTFACDGADNTATDDNTIYLPYCGDFLPGQGRSPVGGASATGASIALGHSALVDNDFDGYIEISNLVALGNIIYNPQGTSYKTSTASKGITSGCPGGVCRGYELTRSFSTTELESGGVAHYLRNILTQDAVIKSNGYSIADIYLP